jgi:hypothetical protein
MLKKWRRAVRIPGARRSSQRSRRSIRGFAQSISTPLRFESSIEKTGAVHAMLEHDIPVNVDHGHCDT